MDHTHDFDISSGGPIEQQIRRDDEITKLRPDVRPGLPEFGMPRESGGGIFDPVEGRVGGAGIAGSNPAPDFDKVVARPVR